MNTDRREFLTTTTLGAGALLTGCASTTSPRRTSSSGLTLRFRPYTLELHHVFTIATSSRKTTPVMLTEVEYDGVVGHGECSMPPYLGESHQTATAFLSQVDLSKYPDPFELETILADLDALAPGNPAAKASVDIALHDLVGKLLGRPWYDIWGFPRDRTPHTSFTIGIDTPEVVAEKTEEASEFGILKCKLGRDTDRMMIDTIRSVTDVPLCVDVNQGWKDRQQALDEIHWLKDQGVVFVEQPMPKDDLESAAWLRERSPLPIVADEACQRLADVPRLHGAYDAINIKLMKCTGMREAHKMVVLAHALGMKVMLGCMTETSCAISAASHLSPMADWADLDGALLISNDVFDGTRIVDGRVTLNDRPGIGVQKI